MQKRWLTAGIALAGILSLHPAWGQNLEPEQCAMIGGASERLDCYDRIFRPDRFTGENEGTDETFGLWTTGTDISDIDATETRFATIESEQLIPAYPRGRAPARLSILCANETTSIEFAFAGQTMGTETSSSASMTFQFDRNPPRTESVPLSGDRAALGYFTAETAVPFINQMLTANRLIVRAFPQGQRSVTVSFQLDGIEEAVAPVRQECGW